MSQHAILADLVRWQSEPVEWIEKELEQLIEEHQRARFQAHLRWLEAQAGS